MTMSSKLILIGLLTVFTIIHGQRKDDQELPPLKQTAGRTATVSFEAQFPRGRCPERFYQVGEECLYFSIDGKIFSWNRVQHLCERRVGEIVQYTSNPEQPNMKPTGGVRQLVINTPQKTEILSAMFREYDEQNWAVRLPFDYDTLKRCRDGQDDKWPEYCDGRPVSNATCFETVSNAQSVICLREVDCNQRYIRFACEFTLPGSADITNSQFRHCTKGRGRSRLLPIWVWITIAVGSALLILIIVAAIIGFVSKSRKSPKPRQYIPEPRRQDQNVSRPITRRPDPATEPMLVRSGPINTSSGDYLEPQPSVERRANT